MLLRCVYCNSQVDPGTGYRLMQAWDQIIRIVDKPRLRCVDHLDKYACGDCVDRIAAGLELGQEVET